MTATVGTTGLCSVSIVSHGHGKMVATLLDDLERCSTLPLEVIVTINVPEDESWLSSRRPFRMTIIRNGRRLGFAANHNNAFVRGRGEVFAVVNPDIRLIGDPFPELAGSARSAGVAVCGPKVLSPDGRIADSARKFPAIGTLLRRRFSAQHGPDYAYGREPVEVDWVAGMFMLSTRECFAALGGFDSGYELYFEDVDLCRRAHRTGQKVLVVPAAEVIHDARRASHRNARHAYWHLCSAHRYFSREAREHRALRTQPMLDCGGGPAARC